MKNLLRLKAKTTRCTLDPVTVSALIVKQILDWNKFCNAENVMLYYPIKNEISLLSLTECSDKNFYLPRIENDEICAVKFNPQEPLQSGKYNINEPCTDIYAGKDMLDIIFIPALMADKWGYRLGYGKGYYDKFLNKMPSRVLKAVPMYDELYCEELPIEQHDEKTDFVVLKDRIIETKILLA